MKFWLQVLLFIPLSIFAVKNTRVPNELIIQTSSIDQVLSDLKSEFQFVATSKCISQHNQLYVLSFRTPATINENHLKLVRSIKGVEVAQFNHLLEERATPNDPDFGVQWYHNNTGQTGGSIGADIHSTEAWDITTGGISSIGDTIVICVVESNGVNINHPELTENIWVNHQEIPDNGIDDDGNGFIDDYYGWRINTQNDDHLPGGHGTGVSGVIGAKGNNNQLIAGVNWNVKIMVVSGFSALVESQVVQGYDYALSNRMLYESSHGTKGAFVVATNSSFGLSGLGPSDAPLWCAMYDTLGKYGILSTGATANSGINVDIDGDLPTTCPSDYLIAVTASDHNDQVNGYGYGPINIDLASPGEGITVLNSTSGITTSNGTSFATPMVTGGIGLAYSISCTDLATLAHNLPDSAARLVRESILANVDVNPTLAPICATSGRLNNYEMLYSLQNNCTGSCPSPFFVEASSSALGDLDITWSGDLADSFVVSLYLDGILLDSTEQTTTTYHYSAADTCTYYTYTIGAYCSGTLSTLHIDSVLSSGCCVSPSLNVSSKTDNELSIYWNDFLLLDSVEVSIPTTGAQSYVVIPDSTYTFNDLEPCNTYTVKARSYCQNRISIFDSIQEPTMGCGACIDSTYCETEAGSTTIEYLDSVRIGAFGLKTGDNGGYLSTETDWVLGNTTYDIDIVTGYKSGGPYTEKVDIYIDLNNNGVFEVGELLFNGQASGNISGFLTIPTFTAGYTKMRVVLSYSGDVIDAPCVTTSYSGETEDYCIYLDPLASAQYQDAQLKVYPNPVSNQQIIMEVESTANYTLIDFQGRTLQQGDLFTGKNQVLLNNVPNGVYLLHVLSEQGSFVQKLVVE